VISIDEIDSNLGNKVQISEKISQVSYASNGNVYLNIGGKFPRNKLSLVIFKNNIYNFADLKKYENKLVRAKGKISNYKGRMEIVINYNWQIQEME
jgi:exonuclease VII large subunit